MNAHNPVLMSAEVQLADSTWSAMSSGVRPLAPARDRLITTLFFAALLHGVVILGVTFGTVVAPSHGMPAIEVLLHTENGANEQLNPEAAYLAQRNQAGSGTTQQAVKPSSPPTSLLQANLFGLPNGNGVEWHEAVAGAPVVDLVANRSQHSDSSVLHGTHEPASAAETPLALLYTLQSPTITASIDKTLTLRGKVIHEVEISPDTQESRIAPYLDGWRRKVERVGTVKFPIVARQYDLKSNPVLEVVVRADGNIDQINVRRSSGLKDLDQAAVGILKLAAPFDAFPPLLRQEFDQLRFAYEWQFIGNRIQGTVKVERQ